MHYHIVLRLNGTEQPEEPVFASLTDAERAVPAVLRLITSPEWSPRRYPGRPVRPDEMVVYLDRTHPRTQQELRIVRCPSNGTTPDSDCRFWRPF